MATFSDSNCHSMFGPTGNCSTAKTINQTQGEEVSVQPNQTPAPNANIINQLNPSSSVKRHVVQKHVVESAPRSLFIFKLDGKFRKG